MRKMKALEIVVEAVAVCKQEKDGDKDIQKTTGNSISAEEKQG